MSRKYNGRGSGKKARGVGNCSHKKHRASGGKGNAARHVREELAKAKDAELRIRRRRRARLRPMYDSVAEAMEHG